MTFNIMGADLKVVSSSNFERAVKIYNDRNNALMALQPDLDRGYEAWRYYFALRGYQWPNEEKSILNEQKRIPYQYNILTPKVNTMAGSIITDLPDIDWKAVDGPETTGIEAIRDSYLSDKEMCDWESALIQSILGALVHNSWVEMVETKKYHPMGNVKLEYIREGSLVPSPYWKSDSCRDLKKAWKSCYFTPEGLKFKYKKSTDKINAAIYAQKNQEENIPSNANEQRSRFMGKVGAEYEVIEEMWLEVINTERLIGRRQGEMIPIEFPVTKDQQKLEQFAEANKIDWETVNPMPYEDTISHKTAVCPSLDPHLILYDQKTRVQCKGLPVFHLTTQRWQGHDKGMAESVMDIQTTLNKRISQETNILEKMNGGMKLFNRNLFSDVNEENEFRAHHNDAGYVQPADLTDVKTPYLDIAPAQYPSTLEKQMDFMFNSLLPIVSGVSDAWSSESAAEDSGVLYERKVQMNKIGTLVSDKRVKQFLNHIGEAYYYQWQITYGDHEREITKADGKQKLILNERLENGAIRNSVKHTPRTKIIVTENAKSPTKQMRDRSMASELLKNINPEINPMTYQNSLSIVIESLPVSDDKRAEFMAGIALEKAVAQTQLTAAAATNTAGTSSAVLQDKQTQMALQQVGAPPPQPGAEEQVTGPEEQIQEPEQEQEMQGQEQESTVSEQLL